MPDASHPNDLDPLFDPPLPGSRRGGFSALWFAMFFGIVNDNLLKNAMITLVAFGVLTTPWVAPELFVTLIGGVFAIPFLFLSPLAGALADKYDRAMILRRCKIAEVPIMAVAAIGFMTESLPILLISLLGMTTQSALMGPTRLAILPQLVSKKSLVRDNGIMEGGLSVAMLIGGLAGIAYVNEFAGPAIAAAIPFSGGDPTTAIALTLVVLAAVGAAFSFGLPKLAAAAPQTVLPKHPGRDAVACIRVGTAVEGAALPIWLTGWFYLLAGMVLTQMPNFVANDLGADTAVFGVAMVAFTVGIAIGAPLTSRLTRGRVSLTPVPLAGLLLAVLIAFLALLPTLFSAAPTLNAGDFRLWIFGITLAAIGLCAGPHLVPLVAKLQTIGDPGRRAQTFGAVSVLKAVGVVASTLIALILLASNLSVTAIFGLVSGAQTLVSGLLVMFLIPSIAKKVLGTLFRFVFRLEVHGLEHLKDLGDKAVFAPNHSSYLDGPVLATVLPDTAKFAISDRIAERWWVKPWLGLFDAYRMETTNPQALRGLIRTVKEGHRAVVFPEGRLTETGALMKIYPGSALIADQADAPIVPVRIEGLQFSRFTRLSGRVPRLWFPKVRITFFPPTKLDLPKALTGPRRREAARTRLYDIMTTAQFDATDLERSLPEAVFDAAKRYDDGRVVVEDAAGTRLTYSKLLAGAAALGPILAEGSEEGEMIGLLLPTMAPTPVATLAVMAQGRVPAMLNYTAGPGPLLSACRTAKIRKIVTSTTFVERAKLEPLIEALQAEGIGIQALEDVRPRLGPVEKLKALFASKRRKTWRRRGGDCPAVVLFTSGSEGAPKGVVLSHRNLLANVTQCQTRLGLTREDVVFNALPLFHSFGITGGLLLPIMSGAKSWLYPSPLHARAVPEAAYHSNATLMFGTDTFLSAYSRRADPYDFARLRYVCAGAERLREETRRVWADRFGVRVLEGYGTTETAPVISVNTPLHVKIGTVGRPLPGMEIRLEPVPGVEEGGRLFVRGPNIMRGYLLADDPGALIPPEDGWHDTGDIAVLDADGFLTLKGRAKRFAKVAGEMISLAAVESALGPAWPDAQMAVVNRPDPRKGERLVLITNAKGLKPTDLKEPILAAGLPELALPRTILELDTLPVLGTGKIDMPALLRWVEQQEAA